MEAGKHHNSALCHVATTLLTRIVACWRAGEPYVIRDTDGTAVSVAERYTVPASLRAERRTTGRGIRSKGTDRRSKESLRAPSTGPSPVHAMAVAMA
ncbi:MAG: hypothetical protein H7Y15_02815 [Pseudonocardia sp.]|nr:hypothetical protein [Pseudonocardia sp.]